MTQPDVTKQPLRDKDIALTAAKILQRMTGDNFAVLWDGPQTFMLVRQEPGGKVVNG